MRPDCYGQFDMDTCSVDMKRDCKVMKRCLSKWEKAESKAGKKQGTGRYRYKKIEKYGVVFDSASELDRYETLRLLQMSGEITELVKVKDPYVFELGGVKICEYTPDFRYVDLSTGQAVVEEVKSRATKTARDYHIRIKLMEAFFGIKVKEIVYG